MKLRLKRHWLAVGLIAVAVVIIAVMGAAAWAYHVGLQPTAPTIQSGGVQFTIKSGESSNQIATQLEASGLIQSQLAFLAFIYVHGLRAHLQAGTYELKPSYSVPEIADILAGGRVETNRLVVPEGATLAQIRGWAIAKGINASQFDQQTAANLNRSYDFLSSKPADLDLEGYLFPDTYQVNVGTTAQQLVAAMLANFDRKVTPDLRQTIAAQGLTLHQGLTLASIVQKEVSNPTDQAMVAGIFLKRLQTGQKLESDVTVIYAADQLGQSFSTTLDSPYNTYANAGLPPGPICSPGLTAIQAVAHPAVTNYLYFVSDKSGTVHYATTFAQHQQNVNQYLK